MKRRSSLVGPSARLSRVVLLVLLVAAAPDRAAAQEAAGAGPAEGTAPRPTALYAELGGNGFFYSVNYEKELAPGWMRRAGLSVVPLIDETPVVAVPLLIERLIGDGPNLLEVGLGVVPRLRDGGELWWTAAIGYRRVRDNGVIFRATFTPLVESNLHAGSVWFGISFGRML